MALMTEIKRFFHRPRTAAPAGVGGSSGSTGLGDEVRGSQADALVAAMREQTVGGEVDVDLTDGSVSMGDGFGQTDGQPSIVETKPESGESRGLLGRFGGGDSKRNTEEVMTLIRRMNEHLDEQSQRTERLLTMIETLPEALQALPALNRQNAQLVDIITDHLQHTREREAKIETTITRLSTASENQTRVFDALQGQLESGQESAERMTSTLGRLNSGLSELAKTNATSVDTLIQMNDSTEKREAALVDALGKTQRWVMASTIACGVLAAGACVVAVIAALQG